MICFFKEPSLANAALIVTGGAKNVEIFFLSSFEKARVTNVVATLVSALVPGSDRRVANSAQRPGYKRYG